MIADRAITSIIAALICVAPMTVGTGCSSGEDGRVEKLLSLAPGLQPESARHLVLSDDSTLFYHARKAGFPVFAGQYSYLKSRIDCTSLESYTASTAVIFPAMKRVHDVVWRVFRNEEPIYTALFELAPEKGLIAVRLMNERTVLASDTTLSYEEKISKLESMVDTLSGYGLDSDVAVSLAIAAEFAGRNGDVDRFVEYSHLALHHARVSRQDRMSCHVMGMIGSYHKGSGRLDSMHVYWENGLDIARRGRMYNQEARFLTFYAAFYRDSGRLAIAQDYYNLAMGLVSEGYTGRLGLRYLVDALEFHADLGAWEIVGRNLPRAKRIENSPGYVATPFESLHETSLRVVEARYLMANGRVEEANAVFEICRERLRGTFYSEHYIRVLRQWADGLLQNGRSAEAVPIIEEGLRVTRDAKPPGSYCRFLIMRARAAVDLGDLSTAESALTTFEGAAAFDDDELRRERIASAVLSARIQKQRHDKDGLLSQLETAVERFITSVKSVDASVHGYLWIGRCEELRRELHLAARDEPKLGYGIELFWRDAFSLLGSDGRDGSSAGLVTLGFDTVGESADGRTLVGELESHADAACRSISEYGGTHCEYTVIDNEVWRWTCSRGDIRRDVLDMRADELEEVAGRAWFDMSLDPGSSDAAPDAGLVEDLRTLSGVLLPPEVLEHTPSEQPPLLFVSADGFIGRLPFETFNVGDPGEYVPLIYVFDVAYVRHVRELDAELPASPGLVVASGSSGRPSRNVCPAPLTEVFAEGERVIDLYPKAELLMNETATKANILSRWQEASFLYLATHLLEDPDVLYMALVPLAPAGESDAPSMSYLDMADIRSADFSRCKTVVLDQCSSGKPYVGARNTSPGLASAFLDAGAATVIQTFWNVRDEDAASFMPAIAGDLESSSVHLIRSLCNAKRAHMKSESGVRHPFRWAPYAIQLGGL